MLRGWLLWWLGGQSLRDDVVAGHPLTARRLAYRFVREGISARPLPRPTPQEARARADAEANAQLRLQLRRKTDTSSAELEHVRSSMVLLQSALFEMGKARQRTTGAREARLTQLDEKRMEASPSAKARA